VAIRWRKDGTLICAAMSEPEERDTYIDDRLHDQLTEMAIITADVNHKVNGLWYWKDNLSLPDWYKCIEDPLKEIVYKLRNNGFNTTNSCGHKMYIEIDISWDRLEDLYKVLAEGWGEFSIEFYWEGYMLYRQWAIVELGNYNPL